MIFLIQRIEQQLRSERLYKCLAQRERNEGHPERVAEYEALALKNGAHAVRLFNTADEEFRPLIRQQLRGFIQELS